MVVTSSLTQGLNRMSKVCSDCKCNYEDYGQRCSLCRECKRKYEREYYKNYSESHKKLPLDKKSKARQERVDRFNTWKEELGCSICGEQEACCLDFHHKDPNTKETNISDVVHSWSWKKIQDEVSKCIVVCSNCHRKIHKGLISV